jgi:hypothetical protein
MSRIAIFIDGGYLDKVTREAENIRIDFQKLSDKIADGTDRLRTYYYHCLPYQSNPPTEEEKRDSPAPKSFFMRLKETTGSRLNKGDWPRREFQPMGGPCLPKKGLMLCLPLTWFNYPQRGKSQRPE